MPITFVKNARPKLLQEMLLYETAMMEVLSCNLIPFKVRKECTSKPPTRKMLLNEKAMMEAINKLIN